MIHTDQICLLHLPHSLAITMLYVALVLHAPTIEQVEQKNTPGHFGREPRIHRRSLRQASASLRGSKKPGDSIGFFVGLNMSMPFIVTIAQEMVSFWEYTDTFDTAKQ